MRPLGSLGRPAPTPTDACSLPTPPPPPAPLPSGAAGVFYTAVGLFRLGFVVRILGHPMISGFMSGAVLIIATGQFKYLALQMSLPRADTLQVRPARPCATCRPPPASSPPATKSRAMLRTFSHLLLSEAAALCLALHNASSPSPCLPPFLFCRATCTTVSSAGGSLGCRGAAPPTLWPPCACIL